MDRKTNDVNTECVSERANTTSDCTEISLRKSHVLLMKGCMYLHIYFTMCCVHYSTSTNLQVAWLLPGLKTVTGSYKYLFSKYKII